VLRKRGSTYRLISSCFLDGFMDGQTIDMWKTGELEAQEFEMGYIAMIFKRYIDKNLRTQYEYKVVKSSLHGCIRSSWLSPTGKA
jgi:hypothetical protein